VPVERQRLIDMLDRTHHGDPWHGPSLMSVVRDITEAESERRVVAHAHTVGEIARHVAGWRDEVRARLAGKAPALPTCGDWPPPGPRGWQETIAELDRSYRDLRAALAAMPSEQWEQQVGPSREAGLGTGVTFALMLHGIVQHDVYHAGQIALLRRALR
jgi:uncharacterized damage-inducible protein DinB